MLKGSSQHLAAATAAAAVVVRPSRRCVLKVWQALPLHSKPIHLRRMTRLLGEADAHISSGACISGRSDQHHHRL